jgi:hypothetical protein
LFQEAVTGKVADCSKDFVADYQLPCNFFSAKRSSVVFSLSFQEWMKQPT